MFCKNEKIKILTLSLITLTAWSIGSVSVAYADGSEGFRQMFERFFGKEDAKDESANCKGSDRDDDRGMLGMVNNIFCHLEKDMGIKGTGSATKCFNMSMTDNGMTQCSNSGGDSSASTSVHCEITDNAAGSTYNKTASCWLCKGSSCSAVTAFNRFMNLSWSYVSGGTNKGQLLMDNGAFEGTAGQSGMNFSWDLSSDTSSKSVTAKVVHSSFKMNVAAQKSGDVRKAQMTFPSMRMSVAQDLALKATLINFQSSGYSGSGVEAVNDSSAVPGTSAQKCFTHAKSGRGLAFTSTSGESACSSLTLGNYPADTTTVNAYTVDSTLTTTILQLNGAYWNSMAANPSALVR